MQNQPPIIVSKGVHKGQVVILLKLYSNSDYLLRVKVLSTLRYSKTLSSWYLPYSKESWSAFTHLQVPYRLEDATINNPRKSEQIAKAQQEGKPSIFTATTNTEVKEIIANNIDQPGTATSPTQSDIASIATSNSIVATTVHPTNGDSKDTDIHLVKGGRSCHFNNGNFFYNYPIQ